MGEGTGVKDFSTFGTFYVEVPEEAILAEEERKLKNLLNRSRPRVDAVAALIKSLKERGLVKGKIALDQMNLTANLHAAILKNLPGVEVIDGYPLLREIRAVKTAKRSRAWKNRRPKPKKHFSRPLKSSGRGLRN
jgi:Xaa-Pro aminopeptidase